MSKIRSIVLPTDFSPASKRALQRAAQLAKRLDAKLTLLHAVPPPRFWQTLQPRWAHFDAEIRTAARTALDRLADEASRLLGHAPETALYEGRASDVVSELAERGHHDLVVIGAVGEHEGSYPEAALGGTALKILGAVKRPVLLVRKDTAGDYASVLCALDASQDPAPVVTLAKELAPGAKLAVCTALFLPLGARLQAMGLKPSTIEAYEADELEAERSRIHRALKACGADGTVDLCVDVENPSRPVLDACRKQKHELLVLSRKAGAKGVAGFEHREWMRTAEFFAPCDVLSVA